MNSDTIATIREALEAQRKYINVTEPTFDVNRVTRVRRIDAALAKLAELEQGEAWLPLPLGHVVNGDIFAEDAVRMVGGAHDDVHLVVGATGKSKAAPLPNDIMLCRRTRTAAQSARPHVVAAQSVANGPCYISGTESRTRTASVEQDAPQPAAGVPLPSDDDVVEAIGELCAFVSAFANMGIGEPTKSDKHNLKQVEIVQAWLQRQREAGK